MSSMRRSFPGLIAALLLIVGAGCERPEAAAPATPIEEELRRLQVVDRPPVESDYRRTAFGPSWADLDRDGCNTRDEVLEATVDKSRPYRTRRQGRCRIDMVAGTWTDLYSGTLLVRTNLKNPSQAQSLPIDHIVSLAGAWRYGASGWTREQRMRFANDPLNLTPTTADLNREKSDQDPATWTPPAPGRCGYATRYIKVKARYRLPVDRREKTQLERLLTSCPG